MGIYACISAPVAAYSWGSVFAEAAGSLYVDRVLCVFSLLCGQSPELRPSLVEWLSSLEVCVIIRPFLQPGVDPGKALEP